MRTMGERSEWELIDDHDRRKICSERVSMGESTARVVFWFEKSRKDLFYLSLHRGGYVKEKKKRKLPERASNPLIGRGIALWDLKIRGSLKCEVKFGRTPLSTTQTKRLGLTNY